jgi:PAS domain S-box-containing protein
VATGAPGSGESNPAYRFRMSLLIAMMLLIGSVTIIVLFIAEHNAQVTYQDALQQGFQSKSMYQLGLVQGRQTAVEERCRLLARSVRIRAALQEDDVDDLYENAIAEMPDMFEQTFPGERPSALRANFVRFINSAGTLLPPNAQGSDTPAPPQPWEKALEQFGSEFDHQQSGYLAVPGKDGKMVLNEVISTPVIDAEDGVVLGAMILGFNPAGFQADSTSIQSGILTGGKLYSTSGDEAVEAPTSFQMPGSVTAISPAGGSLNVTIDGAPCLVFFRLLNRSSPLEKAWQISVYNLADSLASQAQLRFQIVSSGLLVLLLGLLASHFISSRIAKPVEQIAADSVAHAEGRKVAEAALEITEQKYRAIFENAVEGIFVMSPEGRFISVNPAMARIFGYKTPDDLIEAWNDVAKPDGPCAPDFIEAVVSIGAVLNAEVAILRRDGHRIWISQSARAVRDASGSLAHIEGTLIDITERREAADELKAVNIELESAMRDLQTTQQQVIQQERLRALGEMASGIAHDFNNALMPITGFSELLITCPDTDDATSLHYLQVINTAATDAGTIVSRLKQFYRPAEQSDEYRPVMLSRVAKQAATLTQPKWKDQAQANGALIKLRVETADTIPVRADESALRELLTNLIFNAVDAMPKGGALFLRTRMEAGCGVVEITDSGTGMTEETRRRCLEPFYSTKGERGTGLGLAMVFGIVQRHQGSIDISSELGVGTTFTIKLPLFEEAIITREEGAQGPSGPCLEILVVDDEPQVREVLSGLLSAEGHHCETAGHAAEGIHRFRERRFDVVIADKAMPGMSGDQMALSIKSIAPSVPFVLLTGFGSFLRGTELPGVDVIASKPITRAGLRDAIEKALAAA